MFSRLNSTQKGMILVLVPVAFALVFITALAISFQSASAHFRRLEHSRAALAEVEHEANVLGRALLAIADAARTQSRFELNEELNVAEDLMRSGGSIDMREYPELNRLKTRMAAQRGQSIEVIERARHLARKNRLQKRWELYRTYEQTMVAPLVFEMLDIARQIAAIEKNVSGADPAQLNQARLRLTLFLGGGILLSCLISAGLALLFTRDIRERLNAIAGNAHLLAAGRPLPEPQAGSDEIAKVDLVLHESSQVLLAARRKEMAILDDAADIICSLDNKLRFVDCGAATAKVWGYPADELRGMSLLVLLTDKTAEETRLAFQRFAHTNKPGTIENVLRCIDGSLKCFLWTVSWSNEQQTYYCVVHDVTELRAIEKLKHDFLGMVNHDLRAPLSSAGVSLSLLLEGKRGEISADVENELRAAERNLARLVELVNELLDLEKLESGKLAMDMGMASVSDVCEAAKEALHAMATSARISLNGPSGDAAVHGDEKRLVQVVTNLLSNAIKFSPEGSEVKLSISKTDDYVQLSIHDNGPGLTREEASLVFERFAQAATVSSTKMKGTGLGLAIVKAIVDAHDGQAGVDSHPGAGSTFWIKLKEFHDDEPDVDDDNSERGVIER